MNRQIIYFLKSLIITLLFFAVIILDNGFAYISNAEIIREMVSKISSLNKKIKAKQYQAIRMCEKFEEQIAELKTEIKQETECVSPKSYSEAIHSPRIKYNLKLIQQILIYFYQLNDKIKTFQIGIDKLDFIGKQAEDDLKIMETLNDMKAEGVIKQIDNILSEYASNGDKISINIDDAEVRDPRKIWNEMMKEK